MTSPDDTAMRKATQEEYLKCYKSAAEAARERIRAGKGDPEKQKTCSHFDYLIGDLLHGPCVCGECGAVTETYIA